MLSTNSLPQASRVPDCSPGIRLFKKEILFGCLLRRLGQRFLVGAAALLDRDLQPRLGQGRDDLPNR